MTGQVPERPVKKKLKPRRPEELGPEPNRSEMVLYGTGGDFRETALNLYGRRSGFRPEYAEEILAAEMKELGMDPEPTGRCEPGYQKKVNG